MKAAWDAAEKHAIAAGDVEWRVQPVALPPAAHLDEKALQATLADDAGERHRRACGPRAGPGVAARAARPARRSTSPACTLGPAYVLHMPGELFVEYQLAAQQMRPKSPC